MVERITPFLWFDIAAAEAAGLYATIFKGSRIEGIVTVGNNPSKTAEVVSVELCGQKFTMMSAGPFVTFNPSVSFLVNCDTKEEVEDLWNALSKGGKPLMEIGEYPFSGRYGWTEDKYGASWQLMFRDKGGIRRVMTPRCLEPKASSACLRSQATVQQMN